MEKELIDDGRVYSADVFNAPNMEYAKSIIVTSEADGSITYEERWQKETPYLVDEIAKHLDIPLRFAGPTKTVLDYGCGIGRIAKGLIDKYDCNVIGVDFSESMRLLAPDYVLSEKFNVWSPETFAKMIEKGFRVDCCFSVWVIQHILNPGEALNLINKSMRSKGLFYTMNSTRCVPTNKGFTNDGINIQTEVCKFFDEIINEHNNLPDDIASAALSAVTTMQVLQKKE